MRRGALLSIASLLAASAILSGCGAHPAATSATNSGALALRGLVHGGQQPIGYSTIQLYTVGTAGDGSASTPLLTRTVQTDASGNFNITGDYSCSNATQVYLTATGGYVTASTQNPNLIMMAALGPCSALTPSTDVVINELSTIAAVNALYPYMTSVSAIGSGSSDTAALDAAFTLAGEFVNVASGSSPGTNVPSGYAIPTAEINTLGDTMATCINSGGGTAKDGTACGNFFLWTTPTSGTAPTDTVTALLDLANNPTLSTSDIFYTATPTAPFQSTLSTIPANFSITLQPVLSLELSPSPVTFPSTIVNTAATAIPVTVYNNSVAGTVTISSIAIGGTNASQFSLSNGCGATLTAGASCTVQVSATPTATGAQTASLIVTSNATGSPQSVPLSVTGLPVGTGGTVSVSATALGWTIEDTYQDITLTNSGASPITFTTATGTSSFATNNNTNSCAGTIPAQGTCTLTVEYLGTGTSDTLTITSNAINSPQSVPLLAQNLASAAFWVNNGCCYAGIFASTPVGSSTSMTFILSTRYYTTGINTNYMMGGANPFDFILPDCSATVSGYSEFGACGGGAGQCSVVLSSGCGGTVKFTPAATGPRSAKLFFSGSATVNGILFNSNQYIPLTGTGTAQSTPALILTDTVTSQHVALVVNQRQLGSQILGAAGTPSAITALIDTATGTRFNIAFVNGALTTIPVASSVTAVASIPLRDSITGASAQLQITNGDLQLVTN